MNGLIERRLSIDEQDLKSAFRHEPGSLKAGEAGANHDQIKVFHGHTLNVTFL
jgi:hypothetical protein